MSAEPFTREPGYEYRHARDFPMILENGQEWDRYEDGAGVWYAHSGAHPSHYHPNAWFRRKVPAPAQDGWVKFSDRPPKTEDYPIWTFSENKKYHFIASEDLRCHWSKDASWLPINKPAPPKAPTQEEIDQEAATAWVDRVKGPIKREALSYCDCTDAFLAGVRHGRSVK